LPVGRCAVSAREAVSPDVDRALGHQTSRTRNADRPAVEPLPVQRDDRTIGARRGHPEQDVRPGRLRLCVHRVLVCEDLAERFKQRAQRRFAGCRGKVRDVDSLDVVAGCRSGQVVSSRGSAPRSRALCGGRHRAGARVAKRRPTLLCTQTSLVAHGLDGRRASGHVELIAVHHAGPGRSHEDATALRALHRSALLLEPERGSRVVRSGDPAGRAP
jgi:hypothetical protein